MSGETPSKHSFRPSRTIVLCFDGTNSQYDSTNTNVVKFFGLLHKGHPEQQVTYYQAGIGTYFAPGVISPLWTQLASLLDEAFAWYLDAHVMDGYQFLMDNYRSGDKICLFGFSRGAYTARALAGMLTKVGLLPGDNVQQVGFAYKAYKRTDKEGIKLAAGFKETFSRDVKVEFVGVWDTVQSTGVLVNCVLPFTESNYDIRVFRHALSLDEHRSRFQPDLYRWPKQGSEREEVENLKGPVTRKFSAVKSTFKQLLKRKIQQHQALDSGPLPDGAQRDDGVAQNRTQPKTESMTKESFPSTDVLEVWFSGCHSDIGGGNVQDDIEVSLAQITLHWMVEQVIQSQCGILFDDEKLTHIGFKHPSPFPQPPGTRSQILLESDINDTRGTRNAMDISRSVGQELSNKANQATPNPDTYPEHLNSIAPLFDDLKTSKLWWILEIVPFTYVWQDSGGVWHKKWTLNLGRGRLIPFEKPKFHHTVKERMDYEPLKYKPRAIYDHEEVYV